jgi:two-component system LytT family response regulator
MKYKVLIVDDEPLARRGIRARLEPLSDFILLDDCEDGIAALKTIRRHHPDLLFLDIQMPVLSGFDMLKRLRKNQLPLIIFLTAYDEYALRAFEVHALDYLLKPIDDERFAEAITRARRQLKHRSEDSIEERLRELIAQHDQPTATQSGRFEERFTIRNGSKITFVRVDEIDWIEAVGDYAGLHVKDKTPLIRETINALETRLDPAKFVRIHRSTMVQLSRICELRTMPNRELRVRLTSGADLKVSRTYRDRLDNWLASK